jgi:hypothetical protein
MEFWRTGVLDLVHPASTPLLHQSRVVSYKPCRRPRESGLIEKVTIMDVFKMQ